MPGGLFSRKRRFHLLFIFILVKSCLILNTFLTHSPGMEIWDNYIYIYIYIYIYEVQTIRFQTFFVWALLLIVLAWNSSPLWSNLLRLQFTCCTVPTTSERTHGSPLVWVFFFYDFNHLRAILNLQYSFEPEIIKIGQSSHLM